MFIEFDVFGKRMSVQRRDDEWLLFLHPDTGIRSRVYDVVIPGDLEESDLAEYLSDMYHEYGSENTSTVQRLD